MKGSFIKLNRTQTGTALGCVMLPGVAAVHTQLQLSRANGMLLQTRHQHPQPATCHRVLCAAAYPLVALSTAPFCCHMAQDHNP